jgi:hypothetical protein
MSLFQILTGSISARNFEPAAALAIGLSFVGAPALAAGQFGPASDILGMQLTMSKDELHKFIDDKFDVANFKEVTSKLGNSDYSTPDIVTQFTFRITPKDEQAANAKKDADEKAEIQNLNKAGFTGPGDRPVPAARGVDAIVIALSPVTGSNDILSIDRMRFYAEGDRPLLNVLLDSFTEKYGPPTYADPAMPNNFVWSTAYTDKNAAYRAGCRNIADELAIAHAFTYHLENMANFEPTPMPLPANRKNEKCGVALHLKVNASQDGYVYGFLVTLTDEEKAKAAAQAFSDDFAANNKKAVDARLSKDAGKKPEL